jgi:hypothetical protein
MTNLSHSENELISSGYFSRCIDLVKSMEIDEVRKLDNTSANYQRFIDTIKLIMDWRTDRLHGFELEFNADYTSLKKLSL